MVHSKSSHEEAQNAIFRGCARLNRAMQVKRVAPDVAQRWEDEMVQEVVGCVPLSVACDGR